MAGSPERVLRHDGRKHYPMGTRASVEIDAETDEPQTKAKGREFQEIVRDVTVEARATLERRLTEAGYPVRVKIVSADCEVWFPTEIVEWR